MFESYWILGEGILYFGTCAFGSVTYQGEEHLASQEGLCRMELSS
jgi:hypothetical protein